MSNTTEGRKAVSISEWAEAATHYPLLPSGVRVGIRIPDLPALIEAGEIPQHLLEAALGMAGRAASEAKSPTPELIKQEREFTDLLTKITVVEPRLDSDAVRQVPFEDKEFIVQIATRQRDLDAEGEHLAGLTKSEKFRKFRRLGEFQSPLEDL